VWRETTIAATAGLRKAVARLGLDVEEAVTPPRAVEPAELVPIIAAGIRILRTRDASNVTDEQAMDRARNIAGSLAWKYRFTEIQPTETVE